jgi:hypothetical protein
MPILDVRGFPEESRMNIRQRWKQTSLHNKLLVEVGAVAALGTVLNIGVLVIQARSTDAQTNRLIAAARAMVSHLEKANQQQVKLAENSLAAAAKTAADHLSAQSEALKLERRAWVGVTGLREMVFEADKPSSFTAEVRNTGATPARITSVRIQPRVLGPSDSFSANYVDPDTPGSKMVLQPGMSAGLPYRGPQKLTSADLARLRTVGRVYFFGEILYLDVFDRPHFTRFCMRVNPDLQGSTWCDTYNEAD